MFPGTKHSLRPASPCTAHKYKSLSLAFSCQSQVHGRTAQSSTLEGKPVTLNQRREVKLRGCSGLKCCATTCGAHLCNTPSWEAQARGLHLLVHNKCAASHVAKSKPSRQHCTSREPQRSHVLRPLANQPKPRSRAHAQAARAVSETHVRTSSASC